MTVPYAQEIAANLARAEESVQAAQGTHGGRIGRFRHIACLLCCFLCRDIGATSRRARI
jgi:hypothetical protein